VGGGHQNDFNVYAKVTSAFHIGFSSGFPEA
jgi:hypothetical protein